MSRNTYIFAGPPGSAEMVMSIVESALGRAFIRPAGSDPYIRADPVAVYIGGHDFDDGDIYSPAGTPIAVKTTYPNLIDIRDTERDFQRQQDTAARIFAAIKADGRIKAVYIDDMQHVLDSCDLHPRPAG